MTPVPLVIELVDCSAWKPSSELRRHPAASGAVAVVSPPAALPWLVSPSLVLLPGAVCARSRAPQLDPVAHRRGRRRVPPSAAARCRLLPAGRPQASVAVRSRSDAPDLTRAAA
jgi:hypothetical protein